MSKVRQCQREQGSTMCAADRELGVCSHNMLHSTEQLCPPLTVTVGYKYEEHFVTQHACQFWIFACHAKREKRQFLK